MYLGISLARFFRVDIDHRSNNYGIVSGLSTGVQDKLLNMKFPDTKYLKVNLDFGEGRYYKLQ